MGQIGIAIVTIVTRHRCLNCMAPLTTLLSFTFETVDYWTDVNFILIVSMK